MNAINCGGGIKGGNTTFKETLANGVKPKSSSLSCCSTFSKYIFDMKKNSTDDFLDAAVLMANAFNPITNENEKFLALGLLSCEDGKNHREPLNLIVVLDVSGSMNERLSSKNKMTKLDLAKSCLKDMYCKLTNEERIGVITFNKASNLIIDFKLKKNSNKKEFFSKIDNLKAGGGTSIRVGYDLAVDILKTQIGINLKDDAKKKEFFSKNNRIIFLTDALINNKQEADDLFEINYESSKKPWNIFSTFIGIGIDFDTDLVTKLTKVRGSNYFAVHTEEEFRKTLQDDFNYIVTPLCFDVFVNLQSEKYEIQRTFGSEFDFKGGEDKGDELLEMKKGGVLRLETLSAYEKTPGGIKGGLILIKLKEKNNMENEEKKDVDEKIVISITYEDISGIKQEISKEKIVNFDAEWFESTGVRKAYLLSQYVCFVKDFLNGSYLQHAKINDIKNKFLKFFEKEMKILDDKTLKEEYENLMMMIH